MCVVFPHIATALMLLYLSSTAPII